jgi:hypothetical protein
MTSIFEQYSTSELHDLLLAITSVSTREEITRVIESRKR